MSQVFFDQHYASCNMTGYWFMASFGQKALSLLKFTGAILGYLAFVTSNMNFAGTMWRGGAPNPVLGVVAMLTAIFLSRHYARQYASSSPFVVRASGAFGRLARTYLRLSLWWLPSAVICAVLAFVSTGGTDSYAMPAVAGSLGFTAVLLGIAYLCAIDIPLRNRMLESGVNAKRSSVGEVAREEPVIVTKGAVEDDASFPTESRTSAFVFAALLVMGFGVWYVVSGRTSEEGTQQTLEPKSEKVRIIALNDELTEKATSTTRLDVIHAVVVIGKSWVTFDGGWSNNSRDEASALRFAVYEAKRRAATGIQLGFRPQYKAEIGFYVYESAKFHEPDGTFVYRK